MPSFQIFHNHYTKFLRSQAGTGKGMCWLSVVVSSTWNAVFSVSFDEYSPVVTQFEDKQIECRDCAAAFTWTAGEQAYFASKSLAAPRRCSECRKWHREARASSNRDPWKRDTRIHAAV